MGLLGSATAGLTARSRPALEGAGKRWKAVVSVLVVRDSGLAQACLQSQVRSGVRNVSRCPVAGGGSVGWLSLSGLGVPLGTVSTIASVVGVDASASALADEPPVAFGAFATSLSLPAASLSVAGVVAHHCHHAVCISDRPLWTPES